MLATAVADTVALPEPLLEPLPLVVAVPVRWLLKEPERVGETEDVTVSDRRALTLASVLADSDAVALLLRDGRAEAVEVRDLTPLRLEAPETVTLPELVTLTEPDTEEMPLALAADDTEALDVTELERLGDTVDEGDRLDEDEADSERVSADEDDPRAVALATPDDVDEPLHEGTLEADALTLVTLLGERRAVTDGMLETDGEWVAEGDADGERDATALRDTEEEPLFVKDADAEPEAADEMLLVGVDAAETEAATELLPEFDTDDVSEALLERVDEKDGQKVVTADTEPTAVVVGVSHGLIDDTALLLALPETVSDTDGDAVAEDADEGDEA